jgi:agmatine deiminase
MTDESNCIFVPDEAVVHSVMWVGWPTSVKIYGKTLLANVQGDIARLVHTIAKYEPVVVVVDPAHVDRARTLIYSPTSNSCQNDCKEASICTITVVESIRTNDMWLRDTGPVFRIDCRTGAVVDTFNLNFNGWGSKQKHDQDKLVAGRISQLAQLPCIGARICGEGGGVEWDGDGTLMATETSWINRNRNGVRSKHEVERELLSLYGATKVSIWFQSAIGGDVFIIVCMGLCYM